jgi:hypothetical protein
MPFILTCNQCIATTMADCLCPGADHLRQAHAPTCPMAHLADQLLCPCCPGDHDHDHDAAANDCPGAPCGRTHPVPAGRAACPNVHDGEASPHAAEPCPFPAGKCKPRISGTSNVAGVTDAGPCPGGHCGPGVKDCTVCRPMTITFFSGAPPAPTQMRPAPAALPAGG